MLASTARFNSRITNSYPLVAAVKAQAIPEQVKEFEERTAQGLYASKPNWEVIGTCGHRLEVVAAHQAPSWEARIAAGKRHRKRCFDCA